MKRGASPEDSLTSDVRPSNQVAKNEVEDRAFAETKKSEEERKVQLERQSTSSNPGASVGSTQTEAPNNKEHLQAALATADEAIAEASFQRRIFLSQNAQLRNCQVTESLLNTAALADMELEVERLQERISGLELEKDGLEREKGVHEIECDIKDRLAAAEAERDILKSEKQQLQESERTLKHQLENERSTVNELRVQLDSQFGAEKGDRQTEDDLSVTNEQLQALVIDLQEENKSLRQQIETTARRTSLLARKSLESSLADVLSGMQVEDLG